MHIKKALLARVSLFLSAFFALCALPFTASAHEAYVLDKAFFWGELAKPWNLDALNALKNTDNIHVTLWIVGSTLALLALNFLFRRMRIGKRTYNGFERFAPYGPLFVRAAIAAAFFYSAASMSFLGPELSLTGMPWPHVLQTVLYAASIMIALGLFTEIAALAALIVFCIGFWSFGAYLATYLNYLGEIVVLLLFGMRKWSFDGWLFGPLKRFPKLHRFDTSIVRVFYGAALIFAAITVKFLHPALTVEVINSWNLTQFHWLFPHDPLLVTLGGGLAEAAIGLFIIFGFEMRITILISLFYITLSLLFFRELVWPHLMLYGISFNLLVEPETFTLDHLFFDRKNIRLFGRSKLEQLKRML